MKLSKSTYIKKYIGKKNMVLTWNYENNGLNKTNFWNKGGSTIML